MPGLLEPARISLGDKTLFNSFIRSSLLIFEMSYYIVIMCGAMAGSHGFSGKERIG